MPVSIQMAEYGSTMATRQRGSELRAEVQRIAGDTGQVLLDFQGVLSISNSFADEFFGPLVIVKSGLSFELLNARHEVRRVVEQVVERRKQIAAGDLPGSIEFSAL